jgi:hypothetical protein
MKHNRRYSAEECLKLYQDVTGDDPFERTELERADMVTDIRACLMAYSLDNAAAVLHKQGWHQSLQWCEIAAIGMRARAGKLK